MCNRTGGRGLAGAMGASFGGVTGTVPSHEMRQQTRLIDGSGKHARGAQRVGLDDEEVRVLIDQKDALADVRRSRERFA